MGRDDAYSILGVFGIIGIAFTVLFSLIIYIDELFAMLAGTPRETFIGGIVTLVFCLWGAHFVSYVYGYKRVKLVIESAGLVLFVAFYFAVTITVAEFIEPIATEWIAANKPAWPPIVYIGAFLAVFGAMFGIAMLQNYKREEAS